MTYFELLPRDQRNNTWMFHYQEVRNGPLRLLPQYKPLRCCNCGKIDEEAAIRLQQRIAAAGLMVDVLCGEQALEQVASLPEVDAVMAAIVGAAGLRPSLAAARAGKKILLANKEALVMAGRIFMDAVRENGATLLPIDSEHNAIFQTLPRDYAADMAGSGVSKILLTPLPAMSAA